MSTAPEMSLESRDWSERPNLWLVFERQRANRLPDVRAGAARHRNWSLTTVQGFGERTEAQALPVPPTAPRQGCNRTLF